jgi:lipopolysaccharide cholinephosphotransferase
MEKINIDELKSIQLGILGYFDEVCSSHMLRYSLCGGTLLGAIRHQGYIPWDDDIDVFMPRDDYEKLCNIVNAVPSSIYKMFTVNTKNDFYFTFGKLVNTATIIEEFYDRPIKDMGVNIDVFPVDGLPNNKYLCSLYWNIMRILKRINTMVAKKNAKGENGLKTMLRHMVFFSYYFLPKTFCAKQLNWLARFHKFSKSKVVAVSVFGYGRKEELPVDVFDEFVDVSFEGKKFKSIKRYDIYLNNLYGAFMRLPPVEKQVAKHTFEAYRLSEY